MKQSKTKITTSLFYQKFSRKISFKLSTIPKRREINIWYTGLKKGKIVYHNHDFQKTLLDLGIENFRIRGEFVTISIFLNDKAAFDLIIQQLESLFIIEEISEPENSSQEQKLQPYVSAVKSLPDGIYNYRVNFDIRRYRSKSSIIWNEVTSFFKNLSSKAKLHNPEYEKSSGRFSAYFKNESDILLAKLKFGSYIKKVIKYELY